MAFEHSLQHFSHTSFVKFSRKGGGGGGGPSSPSPKSMHVKYNLFPSMKKQQQNGAAPEMSERKGPNQQLWNGRGKGGRKRHPVSKKHLSSVFVIK